MTGMPAGWRTLRATLTGPFLAALALAGGFLAFVAWDQSHWWRVKEDYTFGWLVPAFVAFVVYDRWTRIAAGARACADPASVRAQGWPRILLGVAVAASLTGGVLLFLLGAFYRAGAGTSQPGTLAITLGAVGIVLPLLFLNAPEPRRVGRSTGPQQEAPRHERADDRARGERGGAAEQGESDAVGPVTTMAGSVTPHQALTRPGLFADPRVQLTALFVFPTLVWLVSAPMVSAVESQLSLFLLRKVVTVVSFVFDLLGLPVEQEANVLLLPSGRVGVEDACSGIRSLTGCLFAGSFLAAVFVHRWWQKVALVIAALVLAFITNLLRGLFLTGWAYRFGPDAIGGAVHDGAGYAVLGLTVIGLIGLLRVFSWFAPPDGQRE